MPGSTPPPRRTDALTLQSLAAAAAAGDDLAFAELHDRLAGGLLRFFARRLGGRADAATLADELAQQTWVEVWRAMRDQRYDPARAAISTFIYAVGYRVWLQERRRRRLPVPPATEPDELFERFAGAPDGAEFIELCELLDAVRACLAERRGPAALEADERDLIQRLAAGQSERQIAQELRIAASTVNVRKKAVFAKLRQALGAAGFPAELIERGELSSE